MRKEILIRAGADLTGRVVLKEMISRASIEALIRGFTVISRIMIILNESLLWET